MRLLIFPLLAMWGCTSGGGLASSEKRIDGGEGEEDPESTAARMCVDDDGSIHVAWIDDRAGNPGLWANASTDGGVTWRDAPVRVDHGTAAASSPSLRCAGGVLQVAWQDTRDGELDNANVYTSRSTDGGATWLAEEILLTADPESTSQSLGPDLQVVGSFAYVTWFDNRYGAFDIFLAVSTDAGVTWGEPIRIDADQRGSAYSAWPKVAAWPDGRVVVVWEDSRDGGSDLYARSSPDAGVTLFPEVRIDAGDAAGANDSFRPRLTVDGASVYVVWHDTRNGDQRDIFMNWSINHGQNWSAEAVRVDSDSAGFYDSINPDVVVDDGRAWFAWQDARGVGYAPYVRDSRNGVFYNAEVRVDRLASEGGNSLNTRVVKEGRVLVVAWEDLRDDRGDGYNDLYYNFSLDEGETWHDDDLRLDSLANATSYKRDLQLALRDGVIHAVWVDGRRGTSDIFFQTLPVGEGARYRAP